ncbi:MAG: protein kinase [candidate division KSB1 bacterium]|nr:protein kinase [candidate division KSB1 bacterium]
MRQISGYQIFAELKRGPVTTIYKALDLRHGRIVLVKVLPAEAATEAQQRFQFLQESKLSARLAHPNLRGIYHSGLNDSEPYLILEYVEGPTLFELINQQKKLPIDICLFIAKELARGIAVVHQNNILHRDIKPANIFLSYTGAVKLGDLGLAHDFKDTTSSIAGTPAYMSPEQVLGREITGASDLFSFGAVFYEMLTGEAAFANRTLAGTLHHIANWDPVPIAQLRPEVPGDIIAFCQKLLAKNPADRLNKAEAVIDHLIRLEHRYGLRTTKYDLAAYLESPETYRQVTLEPAAKTAEVDTRFKTREPIRVSWEVTIVVSATMFLAGVLFIRAVKEYMQNQPRAIRTSPSITVPVRPVPEPGQVGYLELRIVPEGLPSLVYVDGDSAGLAPLAGPLALPAGQHQVLVRHPQFGVKTMQVNITAGDTLRQTLVLTNS